MNVMMGLGMQFDKAMNMGMEAYLASAQAKESAKLFSKCSMFISLFDCPVALLTPGLNRIV